MSIFPISLLLFFFWKKSCIYCRLCTWNSCILYCEPYVAIFEIEVIQKNKRKKITRIIQCNPYQDVRNCAFNWKHARYINFDSKYKYVEMLHGSDLQICQTHSGLKWGKIVQKEIAWILDRPRQTVWIHFHCTFFQILKSLCNIGDV